MSVHDANRGVASYPPSHAEFDHVISRVRIGDAVYFLDSTMNGQGYSLARRGYVPYGLALVVERGRSWPAKRDTTGQRARRHPLPAGLGSERPDPPAAAARQLHGRGPGRRALAQPCRQAGVERVGEYFSGLYVEAVAWPGRFCRAWWRMTARPTRIELVLRFEHPQLGRYNQAALELDLPAPEMTDVLMRPPGPAPHALSCWTRRASSRHRTAVHGPPLTSQARRRSRWATETSASCTAPRVVQGDAVFTSRFEASQRRLTAALTSWLPRAH